LIGDTAVKLSQAPGRFLGETWARLDQLRGGEHRALEVLDHRNDGIIGFYRQENLKSNRLSLESRQRFLVEKEIDELRSAVKAELRDLGGKGRIVASGLYVETGQRQAIPAQLWSPAEFDFAAQSVTSGEFVYRIVTVEPRIGSTATESTVAAIRAWLEKRRGERGEQHKKVLHQAAQEEFREAFRVRAFNEAYGATYGRVRGRPQKKN